ncbi:hypothetical protein [Methanobrevibacter sp.]|uniref:hypothetical protein n=1 Tax=Methanobrevibacter sp. TaxID=66852 RepID=UPI003866F6C9
MSLSSCRSNKVIEKTIVYIPEIDWPELPKLPDYEITADGILIKDENYFRQLLVFKTEYQTEQNKYNEKLEKIGGKENEL